MKLFLFGFIALMLVNTGVCATPTNEQLYQMLLDMKTEHEKLKKEVADSKTRESDLQAQLHKARAELISSNKQLYELPKDKKQVANVKEGFFASAGALIVQPRTSLTAISAGSKVSGSIFDYDPGFQVSAGYQTYNNWDYTLRFKHFDTNGNISLSSNGVVQTPIHYGYKSSYNALDFEIGKLFSLSENVALRVSGGIRYAMMNENLYFSSSQLLNPSTFINTSNSVKNNFWSIGPRITASPTWKPFGNDFRVFGNVGVSFLNGQNLNTAQSTCSSSPNVVGCLGSSNSARLDSFVTMVEAGSGIGYTVRANLVDIDFQTGYQFERWIVTNESANTFFRGFNGAYGTIGVKF